MSLANLLAVLPLAPYAGNSSSLQSAALYAPGSLADMLERPGARAMLGAMNRRRMPRVGSEESVMNEASYHSMPSPALLQSIVGQLRAAATPAEAPSPGPTISPETGRPTELVDPPWLRQESNALPVGAPAAHRLWQSKPDVMVKNAMLGGLMGGK